jgi:hypothetical protein
MTVKDKHRHSPRITSSTNCTSFTDNQAPGMGSSFVKPATEHSSCLLALHMFGNHYICVLTGDIIISRD